MSPATQAPQRSAAGAGWLRRLAERREYGVLGLLVLTTLGVGVINPAFLSRENLRDILVQCAPAAIVACGLTLVIITGEIDISVGSLLGLLATVLGLLASTDRAALPLPVAILAVLLLGTTLGLVSGALVAYVRAPSIIVTLGMLTALRGLTELMMGGQWIRGLPPGLRFFGTGTLAGVPVCIVAAVLAFLGVQALATQTPLGRRIYAVGSSPHAARLAGLSERGAKLFVFALTGFLTALATLVSVPQLSVIESGIGKGFEMVVVTSVVVGGTSINGGRGSLLGTLLGVLLLGMIRTVLIFLRLGEMATFWERAIQGSFILLAVLLDHLARRGKEEGSGA